MNDAAQGEFLETDIQRELGIIRINIDAYIILTKHFLKQMVERGSGKGSERGFRSRKNFRNRKREEKSSEKKFFFNLFQKALSFSENSLPLIQFFTSQSLFLMATSLDPINTTPPVAPSGRPIFITVLCILGVIGSLIALPVIFSDVYNTLGLPGWYKGYIIVSVLASLAAIYGMWTMQKWGAYLYIAMGILGIIISVMTNTFSVGFSLILQIAIMAGAFYYSRMMR